MDTWTIIAKSLPPMLMAMLKYTIPLTLISFVLGLILAVFAALVRISESKIFSCACLRPSFGFMFGFSVARRCWCNCLSSSSVYQ